MGDQSTGLATGFFLLLIGAWVVSRTLVHDSAGKNLVDRIVEYAGGGKDDGKGSKQDPGVKVGPLHISANPIPTGPGVRIRSHGFGIDQPGPANPKGLLPFSTDETGSDFGLPLLPHIHVPWKP